MSFCCTTKCDTNLIHGHTVTYLKQTFVPNLRAQLRALRPGGYFWFRCKDIWANDSHLILSWSNEVRAVRLRTYTRAPPLSPKTKRSLPVGPGVGPPSKCSSATVLCVQVENYTGKSVQIIHNSVTFPVTGSEGQAPVILPAL